MKKSFWQIGLTILLVMFLVMPVGAATVIKMGHIMPSESPVDHAAHLLAELVEERTNGRILIEVFPASQLGTQGDMYELLRMGAMQMMWAGDYVALRAVPEFEGFHWPYMFRNAEHVREFMKTPMGQVWWDETRERAGIHTLGYMLRTARHLTANRPIRTVSDVRGMKLRSAENPVYIQGFGTMDFVVTPIAFGELFTALQQGVVDAQENPFDMIYGHGLYEVQSHIMITAHQYSLYQLHINDQFFRSLSQDDQEIIHQAVQEATAFGDELTFETEAELFEKLRATRISVIESPELDVDSFRQRAANIPESMLERWYPGFVEAVRAADPEK